jgi:molecular chaperone GrpE
MTEKEMLKVLEKNSITKFNPVGQKFDPHTMNALMEVPANGKEPGTVAVVFKSGFSLKDRVLRPADVSVVRAE